MKKGLASDAKLLDIRCQSMAGNRLCRFVGGAVPDDLIPAHLHASGDGFHRQNVALAPSVRLDFYMKIN
ncbi:MAG: hypothetical protein R3212_01590 [Xanthomonadales bacterium]|nr:hypothetical protein [Xanthomonadales bacterium]